MKKLLVGLTLVVSMSSFATTNICVEIDTSADSLVGLSSELDSFFRPLGIKTYINPYIIKQNGIETLKEQVLTTKQCLQYFIDNGSINNLNVGYIKLDNTKGPSVFFDGMRLPGQTKRSEETLEASVLSGVTVEECVQSFQQSAF
jgi:hypothetical protein